METNGPVGAENKNEETYGLKVFLCFLWIVSLVGALGIGYAYGHNTQQALPDSDKKVVLGSSDENPTPTENAIQNAFVEGPTASPTVSNTAFCKKTGFAQKWEYLTPYTVKQNDTYQDIARDQLKDATRVNEITQINGIGQVVVGSTLYLPPPEVTKSSGNLREVYGKIVDKNATSWHVSFSSDPSGQGILFPSFWFEGVARSDSYKIGDCVKIFFDDGYKIYSISEQS